MADNKQGSGGDAPGRRRNRPVTLDLKATEVGQAPDKQAPDKQAPDKQAPDKQAPDKQAPNEPAPGNQAAPDQQTMSGENTASARKAAPPSSESPAPDQPASASPQSSHRQARPAPDKDPSPQASGTGGDDAPPPPGNGRDSPRAGGFGMALGGGLAGALLMLVLLAIAAWSGLLPGSSSTATDRALRETALAFAAKMAQLETGLGEMGERIAALQAEAGDQPDAAAPHIGADEIDERLASLESRQTEALAQAVARLEDRLATVEQASSPATADADHSAMDALSARLDAIEKQLSQMPGTDTMAGLQTRLAQLEDRAREAAARQQEEAQPLAMAVALAGLERAVASGRPFARETELVAGLAGAADDIDLLRRHAADGVATPAELARSFPATAARVMDAGRRGEGGSLWERLTASARALVRVRPVGDVEGDSPGAIIARAEHALGEGDLDGAIANLRALSGAPGEAAAPWLARAQATAEARAALDGLNAGILAGAAGEGTQP